MEVINEDETATTNGNGEKENMLKNEEKDATKSKKEEKVKIEESPPEPKTCKSRLKSMFPYLVCMTSFIVQFHTLGFYKSFGPVNEYLSREKDQGGYGDGEVATAWVSSISICVSYLMTPISFEVIRRIKFRPAMMLGATLSGLGLLLSSFASSVYILYVTFGLLFGVGSSLAYSSSLLILPRYFDRGWSFAHGIALSGNGVGAMGLSPATGALMNSMGRTMGFRVMAAVSFSVLFVCGLIYETPKEEDEDDKDTAAEDDESDENYDSEEEEKEEEEFLYHDTLRENKPLILFLISTYLLNFGYYVPYIHLVKLAINIGATHPQAYILPGFLSVSQSVGKVFIGIIFSFTNVNKIRAYQLSLIVLCLATTFVPVLTTYSGLIGYAIVLGFSDGCGQATNMIIVGELAGKKLLPKAYSLFLVCSASAFVIGSPIASVVYSSTGKYSIAFFMCGGMAFLAAALLFAVTCVRDEDQLRLKELKKVKDEERKKERAEKRRKALERAKRRKEMDLSTASIGGKSRLMGSAKRISTSRRSGLSASRRSEDFNMLARSWHSIDFKSHSSKSKESLRSVRSKRSTANITVAHKV